MHNTSSSLIYWIDWLKTSLMGLWMISLMLCMSHKNRSACFKCTMITGQWQKTLYMYAVNGEWLKGILALCAIIAHCHLNSFSWGVHSCLVLLMRENHERITAINIIREVIDLNHAITVPIGPLKRRKRQERKVELTGVKPMPFVLPYASALPLTYSFHQQPPLTSSLM